MIVKTVTQVGNPVIRAKVKPVKAVSSNEVKKIVKNLADSMRHHGLVGMAAPQIGVSARIYVTEIRKTPTRNPKDIDPLRVFINPVITSRSKKLVAGYEGCGSVAAGGLFGKVSRSESVVVEAFNELGEKFTLSAKGILARVIQHEQDHIDGHVYLDRLTDTKSLMSREEYRKMLKLKK